MTSVSREIRARLDTAARRVLAGAFAEAELGRHPEVTPLHVFGAALEASSRLQAAVERRGADPRLLRSLAEVTLARGRGNATVRPVLDDRLAARLALLAARDRLLGVEDLAGAALRVPSEDLRRVLDEFALEADALAEVIDAQPRGPVGETRPAAAPSAAPTSAESRPGDATRREASRGPALSPLRTDPGETPVPWTRALRPHPGRVGAVEREAEIDAVLGVLRQRTLRSALLVGPAGVGRRTVLAEVLARLDPAVATLPAAAAVIDPGALLAGTRARGDLEERLARMADALRSHADRLLLCFLDATVLLDHAGGHGLDEMLVEAMERDGLRLAVAATPGEADRLRERIPRLAAGLLRVALSEPSAAALERILERHAPSLAAHHGVAIPPETQRAVAGLAARHLREPALPARALHLLDAAAGRAAAGRRAATAEDDAADVVSRWTRIPVTRLVRDEADRLRALEDRLREAIKGQDDAIARVARAVRRGRLGLRDPRRPVGSFLFAGPTGVGKTALARRLAEVLFDDDASLVRIDMSEFGERHMVARLLGAPPGYVDSDGGGVLTEAIARRPYSVLLLDEMEKAHPDVFNLLLQILDEGRLSDARGREFDFTHCVVILTTNVGGRRALEAGDEAGMAEGLRRDLLEVFRPELLNRIDETVVFRPLGEAALLDIARLALAEAAALAAPLGVRVTFDDTVPAWIVARRDPPEFGARPVRAVVRRTILDRLAEQILEGTAKPGGTIAFSIRDDRPVDRIESAADGGIVRREAGETTSPGEDPAGPSDRDAG